MVPDGFDLGLVAEEIIGATDSESGELMFLIKWLVLKSWFIQRHGCCSLWNLI